MNTADRWIPLAQLPPGTLFETRAGMRYVRTAYRIIGTAPDTGGDASLIDCYRLSDGKQGNFGLRDDESVRALDLALMAHMLHDLLSEHPDYRSGFQSGQHLERTRLRAVLISVGAVEAAEVLRRGEIVRLLEGRAFRVLNAVGAMGLPLGVVPKACQAGDWFVPVPTASAFTSAMPDHYEPSPRITREP